MSPSKHANRSRGIRLDDHVWEAAQAKADADGIPMATLLTILLAAYAAGRFDGVVARAFAERRIEDAARDAHAIDVAAYADAHTGNAAADRFHTSAATVSRLRVRAAEVAADPGRLDAAQAHRQASANREA